MNLLGIDIIREARGKPFLPLHEGFQFAGEILYTSYVHAKLSYHDEKLLRGIVRNVPTGVTERKLPLKRFQVGGNKNPKVIDS